MEKYFTAEVKFFKGMRKTYPETGYRPDAVFEISDKSEYWGITFTSLEVCNFDDYTMSKVKFTFQDHYNDIRPHDLFYVMEGPYKVGKGRVVSVTM